MRKQKSGRDNPITKNNREGKMINKKFIKNHWQSCYPQQ